MKEQHVPFEFCAAYLAPHVSSEELVVLTLLR